MATLAVIALAIGLVGMFVYMLKEFDVKKV
jgi:hypothetical protein